MQATKTHSVGTFKDKESNVLYIIRNVPLLQALEHYYTIIAYFGKPTFMETLPICLVSWLKFEIEI